MQRNDPTFNEMVSRINSGELTRKQAAEAYGISYGTLGVWMHRSKQAHARAGVPRRLPAPTTPARLAADIAPRLEGERLDALNAALARVLAGESTALGESQANPDVKLSTLTIKVRRARQDAVLAGSPHLHLDAELLREVMRDPVRLSKVAAVIRAAGL